jgi:hypothetical protein
VGGREREASERRLRGVLEACTRLEWDILRENAECRRRDEVVYKLRKL